MSIELDASGKARVVNLIVKKEPEKALAILASLYNVKIPRLRVGTVKKRRKTALAVYVHKDNTIYASNSEIMFNPFVILHEFYHHIRSRAGEHRGTEKKADAFAADFIKSYLRANSRV